MTELGLVLFALYLLEGLRWPPAGSVTFSRRPWGSFVARRPKRLRPDARRGLLLPEPWLPALERFVAPSDGALDVDLVRARLAKFREATRFARPLTWLLLANMFLTGPVLADTLGRARIWPIWIAFHVALTAAVVTLFLRARRRLGPLAPDSVAEKLVMLLLYPPATARFLETLGSGLLRDVDPLPAAAATLDRERFLVFARARLAELPATARGEAVALIEREGIPHSAIVEAPPRQPGSVSYCPICRTGYRSGVAQCADCPDMTLVRYATPEE